MSLSMYQFSPQQAALLSAPNSSGGNFGDMNTVYSKNNSNTANSFGTTSREQQHFDIANYQMFNSSLSLGVDCAAINASAGRPDVNGNGCFPASPSAQRAAVQLDAKYNTVGPTASEMVLAAGDLLLSPARFADQNSYVGPEISDFSFQPRLMGTRDTADDGCGNLGYDGSVESCALNGDLALPYPSSSDPRTMYGTSEPHSGFWDELNLETNVDQGCYSGSSDQSMCNLESVELGYGNTPVPSQYGN